jgi:hypothetical protein
MPNKHIFLALVSCYVPCINIGILVSTGLSWGAIVFCFVQMQCTWCKWIGFLGLGLLDIIRSSHRCKDWRGKRCRGRPRLLLQPLRHHQHRHHNEEGVVHL